MFLNEGDYIKSRYGSIVSGEIKYLTVLEWHETCESRKHYTDMKMFWKL
jgi:hypothetical protein